MKKNNKKKKIKVNGILSLILIVACVGIACAFGFNIYRVASSKGGEGDTVATEKVDNEYSNDQYSIGNNPTDINKKYFKELNSALEGKSIKNDDGTEVSGDEAIAQEVVKNFICQYYTWTNKDGNYDIGGMQYIYTPKQSDFETYTLYNFYKDMDLYITQDGRDDLIQVKDVTINSTTAGEYTVSYKNENNEDVSDNLSCIDVNASWTYESDTKMSTSDLQNSAVFHVVNDNGRWEIGGIE